VCGSNIQSFCGYIKQLPALEQNVVRKKLHTKRDKDGDDMYVCCRSLVMAVFADCSSLLLIWLS